jgi:hypothetical protein
MNYKDERTREISLGVLRAFNDVLHKRSNRNMEEKLAQVGLTLDDVERHLDLQKQRNNAEEE